MNKEEEDVKGRRTTRKRPKTNHYDDPPDPPLTLLPPLPAQSEAGGLGGLLRGRGRARWWGEVGESPCVLFYPSMVSP